MSSSDSQHNDPQDEAPSILLLGDDGRLEQLLHQKLPDYAVEAHANVLEGMVHLAEEPRAAVFLNAELLQSKTVQAVKALRQICPDTTLLLYGQAYAEAYATPALQAGANDYLVCPIRPSDLHRWLGPEEPPAPAAGKPAEHIDGRILQPLYELVQMVPKGTVALVERANQILAEAFGVVWVRVHLDQAAQAPHAVNSDPTGHTVTLQGSQGKLGEMLLGPALAADGSASLKIVRQAAAFLATLLQLAQRDEHLKHLATVDELTGAYNRRYLQFFVRQLIAKSVAKPTEAALLLFDIDGFKYYNDTYSHMAGDEILAEATRLLRRCCREHDVVARIGGDEFAVLFWDTQRRQPRDNQSGEAADELQPAPTEYRSGYSEHKSHPEMVLFMTNRFRRMMRTSEFPSLGPDARGTLTISGGLARFPHDGRTFEDLLAKADQALLNAKRSGKNRIYLVGQPSND